MINLVDEDLVSHLRKPSSIGVFPIDPCQDIDLIDILQAWGMLTRSLNRFSCFSGMLSTGLSAVRTTALSRFAAANSRLGAASAASQTGCLLDIDWFVLSFSLAGLEVCETASLVVHVTNLLVTFLVELVETLTGWSADCCLEVAV